MEMQQKAIRDPLTGIYNRRHLHDLLAQEIVRAERENEPPSIIIVHTALSGSSLSIKTKLNSHFLYHTD
jgi:hypothetical protein